MSPLFFELKERIFILFFFAISNKKLKNLSSLFRTIFPFSKILFIISAFALAISFRLLKFLICASEISNDSYFRFNNL